VISWRATLRRCHRGRRLQSIRGNDRALARRVSLRSEPYNLFTCPASKAAHTDPKRSSSSASLNTSTCKHFIWLVCQRSTETARLGKPRCLASNAQIALFALPDSGATAALIFNAPACHPTNSSREALGITPTFSSVKSDMHYRRSSFG